MVHKRSFGEICFDTFNYIFLGLIAFICLYPMLYVVFGSFSNPNELAQHTGALLWPKGYSLEGYKAVFHNMNIWIGYGNTLFYVIIGTITKMIMTAIGAYVLSRKDFIMRRFITLMIVFTMYFGGGMIPDFLLVKSVGLYDSRFAIIIPTLIATWNLIIMKTAFNRVPESLEESAKLDGANDLTILFKIVFPVTKATFAVIALYYAVGEWNAWFNSMLYLSDRNKWPLQLFLREILIQNTSIGNAVGTMADSQTTATIFLEDVVRYCSICVATLPILCAYPFAQRYFVKGVMMGSIKE
ncbi:MAG: carbohydrate ABC transporter permease [Bacillota bacterium]|nr:carbohydrate ABC transporter permease [Bacillota bacterium]